MTSEVTVPPVAARLTPMTANDVVELIVGHPAPEPTLLLNHNLHSIFHYHRTPWFRQLYQSAEIVLVDGWPILKLLNLGRTRKFSSQYRIGSTDWLTALISTPTVEAYRVYVLGGSATAAARACDVLSGGTASITAAGHNGYFDLDNDSDRILRDIHTFKPHLLLIGMGMPRQEQFIRDNRAQLPIAYVATVGGAIDYLAGDQQLAPRALGRLGLEWAWRLVNEPRRLWHRYLVEPLHLVVLVLVNRIRKTGAWHKEKSDGDS